MTDSTPLDPDALPPPPPSEPTQELPEGAAPRRRWVRRAIIAFLIVANVGIFGGLAVVWWAARQVTAAVSTIPAEELDLSVQPQSFGEPRTLLLIGSDSREDLPDEFAYTGFFGGQRADVIMLVQVLPGEGRLQLLSIPRDLKVVLAGDPAKINAAFNGGPSGIVEAVTAVTGLPIHHYIQVDFAGFAGVVDAIGGIEMTFQHAVRDDKASLWIGEGHQLLDGKTALALARSRAYQELRDGTWVSVADGDIGRTRRQQDLLMAMLTQIERPSSIGGFGELVEALGDFVVTDAGLDEDVIIQLAWEMRSLGPSDLDAATLPVEDLFENEVWYVTEIQPEASETLAAFAAGDLMTTRDAGPADIQVAVQNGNGREGAASSMRDTLEEFGYDVVEVGNADRPDHPTTLVICRPGNLEAAQALVEGLGYGEAAVGQPPPEADLVVIVGLDAPVD